MMAVLIDLFIFKEGNTQGREINNLMICFRD